MKKLSLLFPILLLLSINVVAEKLDPPEIMFGERLFLETRFAQLFKAHLDQGGEVNQAIQKGDPVLDKTMRFFGLPPYQIPFMDGPYAGQSFNCRACHLVDEHLEEPELGMRSYADYAARSPLPTREGLPITMVRNAPTLVDAALPRENFMLHFDGQFYSLEQLVQGTLTAINFGWLPGEEKIAIDHVCKIIKEDNGEDELAEEFGGFSYAEYFSGKTSDGKEISADYLLPEKLRINILEASCGEVFYAAVKLIAIYTEDLMFAVDETIFSPYDVFLHANNLPTEPVSNESHIDYSKRLLGLIHELKNKNELTFIDKNPNTEDGGFQFHDQVFEFGPVQLQGMTIFFNDNPEAKTGKGNCIACHAAPHFTDFGMHNTGITQVEYDNIHGPGAFTNLKIPNLEQRSSNENLYLPATHIHPKREGVFRSIPNKAHVLATDLGAWNVLFNQDYAKAQSGIKNTICKLAEGGCKSDDHALTLSIAAFKTPGLRNLGHSSPFMHNGQISDLHALMAFYISTAENTRQGIVRNGDTEIANIQITPKDIDPLVSFLISLYEDYN